MALHWTLLGVPMSLKMVAGRGRLGVSFFSRPINAVIIQDYNQTVISPNFLCKILYVIIKYYKHPPQ